MDAKMQILKDTFQNRFSIENYLRFSREFFGSVRIVNPEKENDSIPTEYRYTVASYWHLATYTVDKSTLDIFAVKLNVGRSIERARSMQRSFISKLLSRSNHDGAIVAFFTENDPRWRLSFIRLDYEFAAGRAKMNLTPAKRYSYLVGEKEPCHTAMKQLYPIFRDDSFNPTLDRIEEAFSVERVTQEFFDQYKEKYFILKEHLDNSPAFCEEAQRHGFTSEQFAKKLMGQLAFLYFLQKKGWLGVKALSHTLTEKEYQNAFFKNKASREIIPKIYRKSGADSYVLVYRELIALSDDEADIAAGCFKQNDWGSGTKTFIRDLFTSCKDKNFFDDFLEPLFYEALNRRRGDKNYYKRFNCIIPFLNGGLFEPLENYDWVHSTFDIPNDLFSNISTRGEREADGILDIFDRYNFTMNEDEPLEREVAVDPEMLGKIFENLLDANDRKSKGAFYTPREIVHYMCAESLINYLVSKTKLPYDDIRVFILDGEFMKDEDYTRTEGTRRLPQTVFDNLRQIDKALESIKVADPAVGSGAFPLGMLSEIVKARNNITYYYVSMLTDKVEKARMFEQRDPYRLKWDTIQNCIFAVDIEASAVDIAKLRLWLSLVVDEDLSPSRDEAYLGIGKQRDPRALPNLDCNIMCGNSLVDEFDGIQLFDDSLLGKNIFDTKRSPSTIQMSLFMDSIGLFLDDLKHEQERLFGEQDPGTKSAIKKRIDKIIDDIIRAKLTQDGNAEGLRRYNESQKQKTKPYFLWKLEFAKVFQDNGGFDVVIGNPPYVQIKQISWEDRKWFERHFRSAVGRFNLFYFFIEKASELLKKGGVASYIVPDRLLLNTQCVQLRSWLLNEQELKYIISFNEMVFKEAVVDSIIISYQNQACSISHVACFQNANTEQLAAINLVQIPIAHFLESANQQFGLNYNIEESRLINKIRSTSTRLSTISDTKDGIIQGKVEDLLFLSSPIDTDSKPLLFGRDITRYCITFSNNWVNYKPREMMREEIIRRGEGVRHGLWLRSPEVFERRKILTRQTADEIIAAFDDGNYYYSNTIHGTAITDDSFLIEYVLAILNSKLITWYYRTTTEEEGKVFAQIKIALLRQLPIYLASPEQQNHIASIVASIQNIKHNDPEQDTSLLQSEINQMVYALYGLTDDEISIIEESVK